MELTIIKYNDEEVLCLLKEMSPQFTPPLSKSLNFATYADKLANHAAFLECCVERERKGIIAFYPNIITSTVYIPLVWVHKDSRCSGIATRMFDTLINFAKTKGFKFIDLEVLKNNAAANHLYNSLGFEKLEDRQEKNLMRLRIK